MEHGLCLSLSGLWGQNHRRGACQQALISHSSGGWTWETTVRADPVSGAGLLVHRWYLLPVSSHERRGEGAFWSPLYLKKSFNVYLFLTEINRVRVRKKQRERETQNPKQAPGSRL